MAKDMTTPAKQSLIDLLYEGAFPVDAAMARRVLDEARYDRQRDPLASNLHRAKWRISHGEWIAVHAIHFAKCDGRLYLVDGQHRMLAVEELGASVWLRVTFTDCASIDEVHRLYSLLDADGGRSTAAALRALDPLKGHEVGAELRRNAVGAMPILADRFPHRPLRVTEKALGTAHAQRMALGDWGLQLEVFDAIIKDGVGTLRAYLRRAGVVAVALATLRHQPEEARKFWTQVARNELLKPGDPEQALVTWLFTARLGENSKSGERAAAAAWNAFKSGKRLLSLKLGAGPIVVDGTPYQGRD